MNRRTRLSVAALVALTGWSVIGDSARAAPPFNDNVDRAIPMMAGSVETIDTTDATSDGIDSEVNSCGVPATDASVWYTFLESQNGMLTIDTSGSSYSTGITIATGFPGNFTTNYCAAPETLTFNYPVATRYYVMIYDTQSDGGGNGGTLNVSFNFTPIPPTELELTLDSSGQFDSKTGALTLSGTYNCQSVDFLGINGQVRQRVGRIYLNGIFYAGLPGYPVCDGSPQPWTAEVVSYDGKFSGGKIAVAAAASGCGPTGCVESRVEQTVQLSNSRK